MLFLFYSGPKTHLDNSKCISVIILEQTKHFLVGSVVYELKIVVSSYQNSPQEYQTDLEVILDFLEEHYRQESRRKDLWNSKKEA